MGMYKVRQWFEKKSGIQMPKALPWGEWDKWHAKAKIDNPRQYFWGVTLPDFVDDCITPFSHRYNKITDWFRYRTFYRYHVVDTGLTPGYYDCDTRILHANMNLIKDYVEVQLAGRSAVFDTKNEKGYKLTLLEKLGLKKFRSREAGVDYLLWEMSLVYDESMGVEKGHKLYGKYTDQAERAAAVLKIYTWWVDVYPKRPDPMDASGWSAYCDSKRGPGSIMMDLEKPEDLKESKKILKAMCKIEADYAKEEEQMLIKLMKIRQGLWT